MDMLMVGLKGSQRIIFEELRRLLAADKPVSQSILADRTNYHPVTVARALSKLQEYGIVTVKRTRPGCRSEYCIGEGERCLMQSVT